MGINLLSREDLYSLYVKQELSTEDIAKKVGVNHVTVLNYLKKYDIPRRPPSLSKKSWRIHNTLTEPTLSKLYLEEQLSLNQIGDRLGVSNNSVLYYLRKHGIPLRTRREGVLLRVATRKFPKGQHAHNWKGGRLIHSAGYIQIYLPEHPRANKKGYVFEHIVVWEEVHNKPVPHGWEIHHLNGVKNDNRPKNLVAIPKRKHMAKTLRLKDELQKQRIRELETQVKLLERALDSQQMIWWGEN